MIMEKQEKKSKKDFSESLADCAVAIVKALQPQLSQAAATSAPPTSAPIKFGPDNHGISPGKKVNLRSQYLAQLKTLQNLRDDGVLTQEEFADEKAIVLKNLKSLQ